MKKLYFLLFTFLITGLSFGQVFITEIADPNNNADARYIELYNAGGSPVDFTEGNGWQIDKYLNGNTGVNASIDLTGTIPAGGFYIIAYDNTAGTFASVYGFAPEQLDAVSNGVAGSNGDDDLALVDGTDAIVDFFGVYDFGTPTNTDNTGTCAEYEDGRAERLTSVTTGSATFNEAEWNVWADSTVGGCTSHVNSPRTAPGDFDPGAWGTPTCGFSFLNPTAICDAITTGTDTYTATIDFTGGGTATYSVTADSGTVDLTGGDPTNDATGTITITGLTQDVNVVINADDSSICDVDYTIFSPDCDPPLTLPFTEYFEYGSTAGDLTTVSSGEWEVHSGSGAVQYATTSLTLSGYDARASFGGSVTVSSSNGEDVNKSFTEQASGKIYMSALVNVSAVSGTSYFWHFKDDSFGYLARVGAVDDTSGGIYFGITTSGSSVISGTTSYSLGTTYLLVVSYNIDSGQSDLYVLTAPVGTEPSTPESTDTGTGGTAISSIALRQGGGIPEATIDGIRVATTWSNLTLSNNTFEINKFSIYPNPTNTGSVNITSLNSEVLNAKVFDILGKKVLEGKVENNQLNVSNLNAGMYILRLSQNNATVTKKLVIQ